MRSRAHLFRRAPLRAALGVLVVSTLTPSPTVAQEPDDDGIRIGVTFGGISTVGLTLEIFDGKRSLDLTVGTWSFHDMSVSVVAKQYFGGGDLLPFFGGGLWLVAAGPSAGDERTGFAAVFHAPVGLDWQAVDDHHLGLALGVNRALWARRTDPEDDLPLNHRFVPLPGAYYRWARH